jgi:dienelactone hydrolase
LSGENPFPDRHIESIEDSRQTRQAQFDQIRGYLSALLDASTQSRRDHFNPDHATLGTYERSIEGLRADLCRRIGYPPPGRLEKPKTRYDSLGEDGYARIYRTYCEVLEGVEVYGILMIPKNCGDRCPLLVTQHGGGGSPELIAGFPRDPTNYNWMMQRAVQEGFAAWAPGLIFPIGGTEAIEGPSRLELDRIARGLGTSLLALETYKISAGLTPLLGRGEIEPGRLGMIGLSYGGLYTQFTAALDTRIKAAVSSCFFNRRWDYPQQDWTFFNCYNEYTDVEVCAMICPRPLMVEVGVGDELFDVAGARELAPKLASHWDRLGAGERFAYHEFDGGHEFDGSEAYSFLKGFL